MKPLCIDLFCGYGGWARGFLDAGYRVIGFDIEPKCAKRYPGEFVLADVHDLRGEDIISTYGKPRIVVLSPPCTEFSSLTGLRQAVHGITADPWGKGMDLVYEGLRLVYEMEPTMWCMENVRGAERYIGPPTGRSGAQSLWGYFSGFIATPAKKNVRKWKSQPGPRDPMDPRKRALIPYPLARALAEACLP
jgi:hypothetical protein